MRKLATVILVLGASLMGLYVLYDKLFPSQGPDLASISLIIEIKRLEDSLFSLQTKPQITAFLKENPLLATQFLGLETAQDEDSIINKLCSMVQDTSMQVLHKEVQLNFRDLTQLTKQLEQAFKYLKYYYPHFEVPQVVTLITGMGSDLYVSKELIVISLDCFLGEGATFRPRYPNYLLHTYQPSYIVPKIVLLLANQFNAENFKDHTLLHDMLYHGKTYYFAKALLPEVPDAIILGYTMAQFVDTDKHKTIVWQHFIDHELFYITNPMVKKKYLSDRPFTAEIGPGCPGNIAGWLGWQIVKKYMKNNPAITLPMLMRDTEMQRLFMQARYKPQ